MRLRLEIPEASSRLKHMGWRLDFSFLENLQELIRYSENRNADLELIEATILALYQIQAEDSV